MSPWLWMAVLARIVSAVLTNVTPTRCSLSAANSFCMLPKASRHWSDWCCQSVDAWSTVVMALSADFWAASTRPIASVNSWSTFLLIPSHPETDHATATATTTDNHRPPAPAARRSSRGNNAKDLDVGTGTGDVGNMGGSYQEIRILQH